MIMGRSRSAAPPDDAYSLVPLYDMGEGLEGLSHVYSLFGSPF